jgi:hypothetical protein
VKLYKFQALITLHPADDGGPCPKLDEAPRRMVLRGRSVESGRSQFFSVLVSRDDELPFRQGNPRVQVTLRLAGDDVGDYLDIGSHFNLWLGTDVADGIVTRRLFV